MTDRLSTGISTGIDGARQGLKGTAKVFQGFKDFISRGNAIELAVGVVIGAAFGAVVDVDRRRPDRAAHRGDLRRAEPGPCLSFTINGAVFSFGVILQALILFLCTAAAVYFLIVLPMNALAARRKRGEEDEPAAPAEDILLLQEIRDLLANRLTPAIANDSASGPATGPAGTAGRGAPTVAGTPAPAPGSDLPPSIPPGPAAPPKPL